MKNFANGVTVLEKAAAQATLFPAVPSLAELFALALRLREGPSLRVNVNRPGF
jgi:hypothetical protein